MGRSRRVFIGAALAACASAPRAQARRVIRVIVPFSPGGPTDNSIRILGEALQDAVTLVVDNKPGAGGAIGAQALRRAPANGLTLGVMAVDELAINRWTRGHHEDDFRKSFVPVTLIASVPNVLVVPVDTAAKLGIASLGDLVAYAKAHPGKATYASGGTGSVAHLLGEMLKARAGFNALHVPYQGGQPAQVALLGGQVDFAFNTLPTWASQIAAGKVKPLAVTSSRRVPRLPEVPTLAETYAGFEAETWWGLLAPYGTPARTIAEAGEMFGAALGNPAVRKRFDDLMIRPSPMPPADFNGFILREQARYGEVIRKFGGFAP
jgi:tripartite-type tricarboxylate transporter receptor subunit TctC